MTKENDKTLKYIAELVSQTKKLEEENLLLHQQVNTLSDEVDKYKTLLGKYRKDDFTKELITPKDGKALKFKLATVLSANMLGFDKLSKEKNSGQLVDDLDEIFLRLSEMISPYNVKQIKTIGDNIMCVGGIPQKNLTNPIEVVLIAVDMQYYMKQIQNSYDKARFWDLRVGIHTGPISANISGRTKIQYDVKGENVNLASRIASFSDKGQILVSESTYELIKDIFICEYIGRMPVKYQGDILIYEVQKIRPEFSLQGKGVVPNKNYHVNFELIQFFDLQELVLNKLEKELPESLYYHNIKHTIDVVTQTELIGIGEGVDEESLLLLKTAALFHDSGHILGYDDHERYSTLIAREILPDYQYTPKQIDKICELIMATQMPPSPKNILEKIMCDSDLDYLGRSDMIPVSNLLFRELKELNKISSWDDWNRMQINFISSHQYFTKTARSLREVKKLQQIERIKSLLE